LKAKKANAAVLAKKSAKKKWENEKKKKRKKKKEKEKEKEKKLWERRGITLQNSIGGPCNASSSSVTFLVLTEPDNGERARGGGGGKTMGSCWQIGEVARDWGIIRRGSVLRCGMKGLAAPSSRISRDHSSTRLPMAAVTVFYKRFRVVK
jgi:hypothetical protein